MTYWLLATAFMIMTLLSVMVFLNLPDFIMNNSTYRTIFALVPFMFGMLAVIVSLKGIYE